MLCFVSLLRVLGSWKTYPRAFLILVVYSYSSTYVVQLRIVYRSRTTTTEAYLALMRRLCCLLVEQISINHSL